ncbi:MAG: aromatic ring-hydroxylating dioxygenase subunit alpha [Cyanobacteria bacterium J06639_18]
MFLKDKWWAIAESQMINKKPVALRRLGVDLVLWRDSSGKVVCQAQHCPHRGASLALGKVVDGCLQCPYHGFRFNNQGNCTLMPCEGEKAHISSKMRVKPYVVKEAHNLVWLWWGETQSEQSQIPWFEELQDHPKRWASGMMSWNVPFTRAVESLLIDLHHFVFAHHNVARLSGFGSSTLLDPFDAKVEGEVIHTWGQIKPQKLDDKKLDNQNSNNPTLNQSMSIANFRHRLHFPNLAIFDFGFGGIKLFVVATPIDEENTWAYFRYYTPFSMPWVSQLISRAFVWVELNLVQPDDYKILMSTRPRESGLKVNNFVRADKGIVLWHKLYERAQTMSNSENA